ncbi:MAG: hypothetical protein ACJASQ_002752 [Crocinitomicaceae bacterium]|jgi:hypothetical protein
MKITLLAFSALFILFACTENKDEFTDEQEVYSPGVTTEFETLFSDTAFTNIKHSQLLTELQVCIQEVDPECPRCAVCSPNFFRIFELDKEKDVKDFFGLQIKSLTILKGQEFALPVRHLIIFEREKGELIKVNGYRGNLIETISSKSGVDDLMIRFLMKQEDEESKAIENVHFNCLFKWDGKRYNFESVERIEGPNWGGAVKPEHKKETSAEVYRDLIAGELIIKDLVIQ